MTKQKVLYDLDRAIAAMKDAANTMAQITEYQYTEHSIELFGAAAMATEWAKEIKKQIQQDLKQ